MRRALLATSTAGAAGAVAFLQYNFRPASEQHSTPPKTVIVVGAGVVGAVSMGTPWACLSQSSLHKREQAQVGERERDIGSARGEADPQIQRTQRTHQRTHHR